MCADEIRRMVSGRHHSSSSKDIGSGNTEPSSIVSALNREDLEAVLQEFEHVEGLLTDQSELLRGLSDTIEAEV